MITQADLIEVELAKCVEKGMRDKIAIISEVCDILDVPRATVRRAKKGYLDRMKHYVEILS